jgi:hypothetical protein
MFILIATSSCRIQFGVAIHHLATRCMNERPALLSLSEREKASVSTGTGEISCPGGVWYRPSSVPSRRTETTTGTGFPSNMTGTETKFCMFPDFSVSTNAESLPRVGEGLAIFNTERAFQFLNRHNF